MREQNIEVIRKACMVAQPEIEGKHLFEVGYARCKFCNVERVVRDRKVLSRVVAEKGGGSSEEIEITDYNMDGGPCPKHFSRPIRLADVLYSLTKLADLEPFDLPGFWIEVIGRYDLHKDSLTDQSDPCLQFIADLLKDTK